MEGDEKDVPDFLIEDFLMDVRYVFAPEPSVPYSALRGSLLRSAIRPIAPPITIHLPEEVVRSPASWMLRTPERSYRIRPVLLYVDEGDIARDLRLLRLDNQGRPYITRVHGLTRDVLERGREQYGFPPTRIRVPREHYDDVKRPLG